jgi:archaellum biogenesis ATPase FlaH
MPKASTILYPWLRGVIEITGEHDTGKTIAMLQTVKNFSSTVFVDDDIKGDATVKQMIDNSVEFADYIDLSKERAKLNNTPTADEILDKVVFPLMERITAKHHDVIIFDTWRIIYQSARGHVERNQHKYSSVVKWQGSSQIIQGLISKVARMIERDFINKLKENCDLLILSHHVKDNYVANVNVGVIPESSATFDEICNMRIWLRRNYKSKVPVMLFLKRPNIPAMTNKGLRPINIVPLKITPTDKHESIWDAIAEYVAEPIQSRLPRQDETPTVEELAVISGTITDEQRDYIKQMMDYNAKMEKEFSSAMLLVEKDAQPLLYSSHSPQDGSGTAQTDKSENTPANAIQLLSKALTLGYTKESMEQVLGATFNEINANYKAEYWETLQSRQKEGKDVAKTKRKK